ncbi:IucA/IucC family protein [Streptomyces sp. NPDC087218]|uniref:IucA/IucC family protein n=1 Tax=Streptomyces sp. NPDC087218 TaxID=3365769 RepID=UPI00381DF5A9
MNPTSAPHTDGPSPTQQRGPAGPAGNLVVEPPVEPSVVPCQKAAPYDEWYLLDATADGPVPTDLLDHPDPRRAADAAGVENLLRCWARECDLSRPDGDTLRIPLPASGTALLVPVHYWSATGWHRFGTPALEGAPEGAPTADAVTIAALLGREADRDEGADMVARVADSVRRTAGFIEERRRAPEDPAGADLFLTAEQSLLLGHPLHPTPKSREGLSDSESRRYSPESHGSFQLHWMAADRSVLDDDSAWTDKGRPVRAGELIAPYAEGLRLPVATEPIPLHPWQARELRHRPEVAALLDAGLLHDLGTHGQHWHPTSSVRTVHRPGAGFMLKLSLGVRITNSRRENLRKELHRGVEVHRLLRSGLATQWHAAHPGFDIVRDPAWIAVDHVDGTPLPGLDVMIRHNPFGPHDDAVCIAALTAPRPWPGRTGMRSRLAETVRSLATATGRAVPEVAAEWFLRYLDRVVRPVLWLDAHAGVALEAHQQNTLVLLDREGWPAGGRYRDNQGYYFRESHRTVLEHRLPGIGSDSDTFVSDEVTDERFAYYLGINNVFGLIGAFGAQQLADERVLVAAFRRFLGSVAALGSPLPAQLLEKTRLRCKANLLTRLHGLDELVGPVDTQSVYVTIANPLCA